MKKKRNIMSTKTKVKYSKQDPVSHVLLRPDMYVGSTRSRTIEEYVATRNNDSYSIFKEEIVFSPAILRIFIEPLSNAIDNVERSKEYNTPCTKIKININQETGETSVWNDGYVIPIERNEEEEDFYNHSMIFGQLLTGSNYDDEQERIISGRNGIGGKATNIFSTYFKVKGVDTNVGKSLIQEWRNNMKDTEGPVVKNTNYGTGFTEVTWIPDFERFNLRGYTEDIIKLYTRYIIDAAMLTNVDIFLNRQKIEVNNLLSYSRLYQSPYPETLFIETRTAKVLLTPSTEFQVISFVNGVYTRLGGQHVDAWVEALFRPLLAKLNKKGKPSLNIKDVKNFFRLFVVATVVNPEFNSQDKNKLEAPVISASVTTKHISTIMKWSIIADIEDIIRSKEMIVMKKAERKRKSFVKIEGLDPANNAGTNKSEDCTLILCEGLSAKTYAVAGIERGVYGREGRDWFGIFALRGKPLNVRNASPSVIAKNSIITDLIQALGVRHGIDYRDVRNYKQLSYGKIMLLADADVDGIHIEGLIMNVFHSLFPSLLEREEPFIVSMKTPIVRVFRSRGEDLLFYDERRFTEFSRRNDKIKAKYYKGLGTTKPEDVPDTFGKKMVEYIIDENTSVNMNKVFNKRFADARKEWLAQFDPNPPYSLDDQGEVTRMSITNFVDGEMIKFSKSDCARSIPNIIDGLKESQRKVLFAVLKRNLRYSGTSLKVAQLGGYVAEHTNYHHGEQNLFETIIKMANEFPGSNNIPLLYRDGMMGTRLSGGKDAASPRYIFTKMDMLTHLIFRSEDIPLLENVIDDGDVVEPKIYVPIIPMILVNGCLAIGTGWSSNIPCYNPLDLINSIKVWLRYDGEVLNTDEDGTVVSLLPEIKPWYRDFEGEIERDIPSRYVTKGVITKSGNKTTVTELPIGMWTDKFKEMCEDFIESKSLKSMKNYSTPKKVNFILTETQDGISCNLDNLKLRSYLYTSNMVAFNKDNQLIRFADTDQIIDYFCRVRYDLYIKRKAHMLNSLEKEMKYLGNKARFIQEVIDQTLDIMNVEEEIVIRSLEDKKYDKDDDSFDYLLRMHVRTFTANKIRQIQNDIASLQEKIDGLRATSEKQLWLNDLNEFEREYNKFLRVMENTQTKSNKKKNKK